MSCCFPFRSWQQTAKRPNDTGLELVAVYFIDDGMIMSVTMEGRHVAMLRMLFFCSCLFPCGKWVYHFVALNSRTLQQALVFVCFVVVQILNSAVPPQTFCSQNVQVVFTAKRRCTRKLDVYNSRLGDATPAVNKLLHHVIICFDTLHGSFYPLPHPPLILPAFCGGGNHATVACWWYYGTGWPLWTCVSKDERFDIIACMWTRRINQTVKPIAV